MSRVGWTTKDDGVYTLDMSAKRYSGNAIVTLSLDDAYERREPGRQSYKYSITQGSYRASGYVSSPITIAVDSPRAFDEVARSALVFASHDREIDGDELDYSDSGVVIRRKR